MRKTFPFFSCRCCCFCCLLSRAILCLIFGKCRACDPPLYPATRTYFMGPFYILLLCSLPSTSWVNLDFVFGYFRRELPLASVRVVNLAIMTAASIHPFHCDYTPFYVFNTHFTTHFLCAYLSFTCHYLTIFCVGLLSEIFFFRPFYLDG